MTDDDLKKYVAMIPLRKLSVAIGMLEDRFAEIDVTEEEIQLWKDCNAVGAIRSIRARHDCDLMVAKKALDAAIQRDLGLE